MQLSEINYGSITSISTKEYTLYPQRCLILFSFSIFSMVNAWIWIAWSTLAPEPICTLWKVSSTKVDALSSIYLYIYLLYSPISLWMIHNQGLRFSLLIESLLNCIDAGIRFWNAINYITIYIGRLM